MRLLVRTDCEAESVFNPSRKIPPFTKKLPPRKKRPPRHAPLDFQGLLVIALDASKMRRSTSHRSLSPDNLIPGMLKQLANPKV